MEDGHTLFDYDVRLNDTIQLLVRQSLVLPPSSSKERDSELSDTDSGCCLGQSESDKSSNSGEVTVEADGKTGLADEDVWDETELGLYKVSLLQKPWGRGCSLPGRSLQPQEHCPRPSVFFVFRTTQLSAHEGCSHPSLWLGTPRPAMTTS